MCKIPFVYLHAKVLRKFQFWCSIIILLLEVFSVMRSHSICFAASQRWLVCCYKNKKNLAIAYLLDPRPLVQARGVGTSIGYPVCKTIDYSRCCATKVPPWGIWFVLIKINAGTTFLPYLAWMRIELVCYFHLLPTQVHFQPQEHINFELLYYCLPLYVFRICFAHRKTIKHKSALVTNLVNIVLNLNTAPRQWPPARGRGALTSCARPLRCTPRYTW